MFTFLVFLSAFLLEAIGTYVSVIGLGHLFAYSPVVMIMAVALDIAKVVNVTFLYRHWKEIGWTMKSYMLTATMVLMMITSTGVFGYLSGEFQRAIAGNTQQTVVIQSLTDEQVRLQKRKEEIDKQIAQLPQNNVRGRRLLMQQFGPEVGRINERLAEIDKKLPELKVANIGSESHVGPILYVAKAFDTTPEQAVKWIILTIIGVFDPLAIALLVAGNFLFLRKKDPPEILEYEGLPPAPALTPEFYVKEDTRKPVETPPVPTPASPTIHGNPEFAIERVAEKFEKAMKQKRKYVRKPKVAPAPTAAPMREKVVIKKPVKKPEPPKVVVTSEGDKEVITLEKPLMQSSLESINVKADTIEGSSSSSKVAGTYEKDD